jgi:hypothetical protein
MFWNKPKVSNIKFSTFDPFLLENLPPVQSNKLLPDWFRNTHPSIPADTANINSPFELYDGSTIRKCPALNEYFSSGITFPLWTDLEVFVDSKKRMLEWRYSNVYDGMSVVTSHPNGQFPQLANKYLHSKIHSPWIAQCDTGIHWLMTKPAYSTSVFDEQDVILCDGMVQFKANFNMHINMFFPIRDSSYTIKFNAGEPILKLIPLSENRVNMTTAYCSSDYYNHAAMFGRRISFSPSKFYNTLVKNNKLKEK